jgi:hypothetical protein
MKHCPRCDQYLPLEAFAKNTQRKDGLQSECRPCFADRHKEKRAERNAACRRNYQANREQRLANMKRWQENNREASRAIKRDSQNKPDVKARKRSYALNRSYGLESEAAYAQLSAEQDHLCGVCQKPSTDGRPLSVDHDHMNGKIRGLLCRNCNVAAGLIKDDPDLAYRLAEWLRKSRPIAESA